MEKSELLSTKILKRKFLHTPNATHITKSINKFPNVKSFLETLVKNADINVKEVGKMFEYNADIIKNRCYANYGIFMDYFIRKHLSNQFDIEIMDHRAELVIENTEAFKVEPDLCKEIIESYEIFKNPETKAMDIIENIKNVALTHSISFGNSLPKHYSVDEENLQEVVKYFQNLPHRMVDLNPVVGCKYFQADADLIFDNDVLYDIKTSKYISLTPNRKTMALNQFYQHIIYSFGFYKISGKMIKKFKIYNPLLGYEHSMELKHIDYDLFEKALEKDVEAYDKSFEENIAKRMKHAKEITAEKA